MHVLWPEDIRAAIEDGRWSISPAELWIELVMIRLIIDNTARDRSFFVTDFTDNESARAAANRGASKTMSMDDMASDIAICVSEPSTSLRTMRVTTSENHTSDRLSREQDAQAAADLAQTLDVPLCTHNIASDDPAWEFIRRRIKACQTA